jgi:proprotein convertase subtilisin/kexin type 5
MNNCSTCTGPSQCTRCSNGFIENATKTRCEYCDTEQDFFIDSRGVCRACDSNCSKCEDSNFCLICKPGYTMQKIQNQSKCIISTPIPTNQPLVCNSGFYLQAATGTQQSHCVSCDPECKTCNGPGRTRCTDCDSIKGFELNAGRCRCKQGTYFRDSTGDCDTCFNPDCAECSGPGKDECCLCKDQAAVMFGG